MAPCVIILVLALRTSSTWQPDVPQLCAATRRSPGFTKRMNSELSFSHAVYARMGLAELLVLDVSRGTTWAARLVFSYPAGPASHPASILICSSPPWQSVHPSLTVPVGCIVALSGAV